MAWQDEVSSSHGRLSWLAVSPKHRRKGIAQALCYCVLKYHKDHGKTYTWLRVGRFRTREIAKQVYEKVGFKME
jgi:GNAT superfamily N-acetyltransferase